MRRIAPTALLLLAFGCAETNPGPGPMTTPPPGADAGAPTGGGPLLDTSVLGELDELQRVMLCEEDASSQLTPTQQQVCTVDAIYDAADAMSCVTARDACMAETWDADPPADCAGGDAAYLATELAGCSATVAQYRACRGELDAMDRQVYEIADCNAHAGDPDSLYPAEEPAGCAALWAACPSVFSGDGEG